MKRLEIERQAIERALKQEPNITEAAQALGASRRTLQSRMRDYSIPPGQAGRPRTLLPHHHKHLIVMWWPAAAVAVVVLGVGALIYRSNKKEKPARLSGLDLLGATR